MAPLTDEKLGHLLRQRLRTAADSIEVPDDQPTLHARLRVTNTGPHIPRPRFVVAIALAVALLVAVTTIGLGLPQRLLSGPVAAPAPSDPDPTSQSALNGRWTAAWTREELASSPLTEEGELNDGNWGTFSLVLRDGHGQESIWNARTSYEFGVTYRLDGDILTLDRDDGEHFVMRWRIDDERLILTRDPSLGEAPVAFVLKPLVH